MNKKLSMLLFIILSVLMTPALVTAQGDVAEGNVHYLMGDYARAEAEYQQAVDLNRNDIVALNNRGAALIKQNKYQEAKKSLETALTMDPQNPYVYFNLGILYTQINNKSQALWAFQSALIFKPEFERAQYNLEVLKKTP